MESTSWFEENRPAVVAFVLALVVLYLPQLVATLLAILLVLFGVLYISIRRRFRQWQQGQSQDAMRDWPAEWGEPTTKKVTTYILERRFWS
jgi:hypothetical protein